VKLLKEHERIWKDVAGYPTNQDAATAISKMVHSVVQVQTVRRRFGPSGRSTGTPKIGSHAHSHAHATKSHATKSHATKPHATKSHHPAKSHPGKSHHDGGASPPA
jgi:hypothetical protein